MAWCMDRTLGQACLPWMAMASDPDIPIDREQGNLKSHGDPIDQATANKQAPRWPQQGRRPGPDRAGGHCLAHAAAVTGLVLGQIMER